jgi:hypothetical protein
MSLRAPFIVATLLAVLTLLASGPAYCERTFYLSVCQELVNQARAYEARATAHGRIAKSLMAQIQGVAAMPKSQATAASMDALFSQYDENRALENKFQLMYRQSTEESDRCMKSAQ